MGGSEVQSPERNIVVNTDDEMSQTCVQPDVSIESVQKGLSVQRDECEQTTVGKSIKTGSGAEDPTSTKLAGRNIRARFKLSKIEGGRFSLKLNSTEKKRGPVKEGAIVKDNDSDRFPVNKSLRDNLHNLQSLSARDEIRGENSTFNNITILRTPKRKKSESIPKQTNKQTVSRLVSKFSSATFSMPGGGGSDESPAKRRRLWGQGH